MAIRMSAQEREEWTEELRRELPPGAVVHTVLRHVSASGMTRSIDVYLLTCDGGRVAKWWLSYRTAAILGESYDERREAVRVSGAGMDMGFHLVYRLAHALYPDGFPCVGDDCPSNAHSNGAARPHDFPVEYAGVPVDPAAPCPVYDRGKLGDRCGLPASAHPTLPVRHSDGGYALRHEWL